jgi:hypothetical protein
MQGFPAIKYSGAHCRLFRKLNQLARTATANSAEAAAASSYQPDDLNKAV